MWVRATHILTCTQRGPESRGAKGTPLWALIHEETMGGGGGDGGSPSKTGGYQNFTREVSLSNCFHCQSVVGISVFIS